MEYSGSLIAVRISACFIKLGVKLFCQSNAMLAAIIGVETEVPELLPHLPI